MTLRTKQRLDLALTIKSVSDTGEFEGYGSVFGVEDSYGDVVVKGAFEKSLASWREKGRLPAMLWQHDTTSQSAFTQRCEKMTSVSTLKAKLLIDGDPLAKRAHAF